MDIFITISVTFFAGMGAGLGTGFAGMSAAAVISPMFWRVQFRLIHTIKIKISMSETV